ncbi:MAG: 16S rRNA (uracil(1498)-N(3))-methyltransferase [Paludibacteraceae bacterium]|nr:16S rRNA (uracil(1498)-N(3))-methyltransferase [Paludibacteraceae bacterium]
MSLFYAPEIETTLSLPEEESFHAVKVLRMKEGDALDVFDGKGGYFKAVISFAHHKHCEVKLVEKQVFEKRPYSIHIAVAPTKNLDRIEWMVDKLVEMGVDEITPIICRFSERKILKTDRLKKIVVSASKQSKNVYIPQFNEPIELKELLKKAQEPQKFIAHCYENEKQFLSRSYKKNGGKVLILIGPEGDFSTEEVDLALKQGFAPVSLGESRLRTETAAMVACHTIHVVEEL